MQATSDPVWYRRPSVLAARPLDFFPRADQSGAERANALVRLVAYATLAAWAYGWMHRRASAPRHALLGLGLAALVSFAYDADADARPPSIGGLVTCAHAQRGATRRCVASTPDNPFGNALPGDDPRRGPACPYDEQADLVRRNFNRGLVRDAYDVWDRQNSQRQFVTNPVTTPVQDTVAFANACYGNPGRRTCKEDTRACTGHN